MKEKGFTLAELLAVIVILALLAVVTVPIVNILVKDAKERVSQSNVDTILSAAYDWSVDNALMLPSEVGDAITITLAQLKLGGYIALDIHDATDSTLIPNDSLISIVKTVYNSESLTPDNSKYYNNYLFMFEKGVSTDSYDVEAPIIVLSGNALEYVSLNETYVEPGYTAYTNEYEDISDNVITTILYNDEEVASIDTSTYRVYTIEYQITNNNITTSIRRTVIVSDSLAPELTIPSNKTMTLTEYNMIDFMEDVSCIDNSGNCTITHAITESGNKRIITYTATDSTGNKTSKKRVLTLNTNYDITFSKSINTITINYPDGYINEYSLDNGITWNTYIDPILLTRNGTIIARISDGANYLNYVSFYVTSIDYENPNASVVVTDEGATITLTDNIGVFAYAISTSDTATPDWTVVTHNPKTFTRTYTAQEEGTYYVHVVDVAGNAYSIPFKIDYIIQTGWKRWAQLASINYKNYADINALLADGSAVEILSSNTLAIDYMVTTPEILTAVVENNKLESFFNNKHALFKMTESNDWYTAIMNSTSKDAYIALMNKIPKMTADNICSDLEAPLCGIASASRSYTNTPPYKAFDDVTDLGNGWSTNGQRATATTQNWLMYEFNNNVQIMGYSFYLHNYGGNGCYYNTTSNIKIEYSLDGETWNTIAEASLAAGTTHTIYFEETYTVKYMRVTVTGVNSFFRYTTDNDWQAINELDFFGVKVE